jgi:hypothetical protein
MCFLILHKLVLVTICAPKIIFPHNLQVLQNYLQASGNVLDAAIRAYKDYLAERSTQFASARNHVPSDEEGDSILSECEGMQHLHIFQSKDQQILSAYISITIRTNKKFSLMPCLIS